MLPHSQALQPVVFEHVLQQSAALVSFVHLNALWVHDVSFRNVAVSQLSCAEANTARTSVSSSAIRSEE
jgi:hypothetical protein